MTMLQRHLATGFAILFLGGCTPTFVNLAPVNVNQNPSGIYTLQAEVDVQDREVIAESVQVIAVVGGESVPMVRGQLNDHIWSCDYKMRPGYDEATYKYVAKYRVRRGEEESLEREQMSKIYRFRLENRYVGNLTVYRAPVGTEVSVQGRGFTRHDRIRFGGRSTVTRHLSENELRFTVPALSSGVSYPVQLIGGPGPLDIGDFRIDESIITVYPTNLDIVSGDREFLIFKIDFDAPAGGLVLDVTTDVPRSVIMPVARIPEGSKTINITVTGGEPGSGNLFVNVPGMKEVVVPVVVH